MQRRSTFQTTLGAMQAFNNVFDRIEAAEVDLFNKAYEAGKGNGQAQTWQKANIEIDRLVVAYNREHGNTAALREALKLCVKDMCEMCRFAAAVAQDNQAPCLNGCETLRVAKAALDATEGGEREHQ